MLLDLRLGPGGNVAAYVNKSRKTGKYDFAGVDKALSYLIPRGMNVFIAGTAPNLKRENRKVYTPEFIAQFTDMLRAYADHLRVRGWIDMAYVYTFDEAPKKYWPEVRKIARAIKKVAPEFRIIQCLNQPQGVKALADVIDVFDVYVAQYQKTGVSDLQKRGTKVWLAVCCYPMDHPNLFIEYPLIDARMLPMFCWKYGAEGFEYWSPNSWGKNWRRKPPHQWPNEPWDPNTFGRYNGDGYLLYPGPDGEPYPSIRLEAFRDGMEDYEYLWLLRSLVKKARAAGIPTERAEQLLRMDGFIADDGTYSYDRSGQERYWRFRRDVAEEIEKLARRAGL
jgi:hypothetical protein